MTSDIINAENLNSVMALKKQKQLDTPHYATVGTAMGVLTDYDSFPYTRWFRGQYRSDRPIVAEREAGWRMRDDRCYEAECQKIPAPYPDHCFQAACSTVYPCNLNRNGFKIIN